MTGRLGKAQLAWVEWMRHRGQPGYRSMLMRAGIEHELLGAWEEEMDSEVKAKLNWEHGHIPEPEGGEGE